MRTAPRLPGAKGYPKAMEVEAAKLLAEVGAGRHQGSVRAVPPVGACGT
ncbi:MAG TPA: hypothetical protein VME46_23920 [Acidimicrobiales bacterium]|nr:hypothetical protein [Acidimicrobiales bacterium]